MRLLLNNGKIEERGAEYAARLIEQGKARPAPAEAENAPRGAEADPHVPKGQKRKDCGNGA